MPEFSVPPSCQCPVSERDWDKLVNLILEGCVVPVLGAELLCFERDGHEELLYNAWGQALLAEHPEMTLPQGDDRTPLLYQVTNKLSLEQNAGELAYDIDAVIRRQAWPIPEGLRRLASITSFPLFITATIDHLLVDALETERPEVRGKVNQIIFRPHGVKSEVDLPDSFPRPGIPTVFHIFGATGPVEGTFAKTEDDLIVFSWSLIDQQYAPQRLYDYLRQKTILLLGCCFPDWLGRFLVHALHAGRLDACINAYHVCGSREPGLESFLRRKRAKIFPLQSPNAFVEELHRRWQANKPAPVVFASPADSAAPNYAPFKKGSVFLSYAREDRDVVLLIKAQLEAANIDTWMDESDLDPGADLRSVIHDNIKNASFFIAIISRSLDDLHQQEKRMDRFLWGEWKWADTVSEDRRVSENYLQPLAIDDTPCDADFVEPPFRGKGEKLWTRLQDGKVPDKFIEFLNRGIRSYRRAK